MASIRMAILDALATRLATIPDWTARVRNFENPEANAKIVATVYFEAEDKKLRGSQDYLCTMTVGVEVVVRREDVTAGAPDNGNAFRYLDRQVVLLEKKVHAPDSWGVNPDFTDVQVTGHVVDHVDGSPSSLIAYVQIVFSFTHEFTNPEAA